MDYEGYFNSLPYDRQLREFVELSTTLRSLEENRKAAVAVLLRSMKERGVESEQVGDVVVAVLKSSSSRVDRQALLEHGVSPEIIQACTVETQYETVTLRRPRSAARTV